MTVRVKDNGLAAFDARLRDLTDGVKISVGIHPDDGAKNHPSGGKVGEVAVLLELGSDTKAPVGFLRTAIDGQRDTLARTLADAGQRVLEGETIGEAFAPAANELAADVRKRVPVDSGTVRDAVESRVNGTRAA